MLTLYILAAIIIPGTVFLIYCFVGFSRAERRKGKRHVPQATGEQERNYGRNGMYKAVLATLALTVPAALAPHTAQALNRTPATAEYKLPMGCSYAEMATQIPMCTLP